MKPSYIKLSLLLFVVVTLSNCGVVNGIRAKSNLNDGARAYKGGDFKAAEESFTEALRLDPTLDRAKIFRARAIERQYKRGVTAPENQAQAQRALEVYREILANDPGNEEAYNAIASLLGALHQTDEQRAFIQARATNESLAPDKRALAYTFLANNQWRCAYDITELPESKQTVERDGKTLIEYKKPTEESSLQQAKQCADQGLQLARSAVNLNPNSPPAYAALANLLLEQSKFAQMEGNQELREQLLQQSNDARSRNAELSEAERQKKEAEEAQRKAAQATS